MKKTIITYHLISWLLSSLCSPTVFSQAPIQHPVRWINEIGANQTVNSTILIKTHSLSTWNSAGAVSAGSLDADTDGWIEFTASNGVYIIGFALNNVIDYDQFTHAVRIDYTTPNSFAIFEGSATTVQVGSRNPTDVFRISREGNIMNYFLNGSIIRSVNVNSSQKLRVKCSLKQPNGRTPAVISSISNTLIVRGTVNGINGTQRLGDISLSPAGGVAPYSYSWSSGEQGNPITEKLQGTYQVAVSDATGQTVTRSYSVGHNVIWVNPIGVTVNGSQLRKTQPHWTWIKAGAVSSNTLPANTDGWIEFSGTSTGIYIIGLAASNTIDLSELTNAFMMDYYKNTYTIYEGSNIQASNFWDPGDIFRISRVGSIVTYYRNDEVIRSVTVDPGLILQLKTSIQQPGAITPNITASFPAQLILQAAVFGPKGNKGSGAISTSPVGGTSPYTFQWSNHESTSSLTDQQRGVYTVHVADAAGRSISRKYNLGYDVDWSYVTEASISGSRLTKTQPHHTWNKSGGVSSNQLPANEDGWIEFIVATNTHCAIGFATNSIIDVTQFSNAVVIDFASNKFVIYEGSLTALSGNLKLGDVFRISREGSFVKYYQNDVVIGTVTVNATLALKIKTAIKVPGSNTPYISSSFWKTDGISRTYYSIANGNWTNPSIWSLTENGPPSTVYPDDIDKVVIKGHEVIVDSNIKSAGIDITSVNENTRLKIEGNMGTLTVKGNIIMNREHNLNTTDIMLVQNGGRVDVK